MIHYLVKNDADIEDFINRDETMVRSHELVFVEFLDQVSPESAKDLLRFLNNTYSNIHIKDQTGSKFFELVPQDQWTLIIDQCEEIQPNYQSFEFLANRENLSELKAVLLNYTFDRLMINPKGLDIENDRELVRDLFKELEKTKPELWNVYFQPSFKESELWERFSQNFFKGPEFLDIDISNSCNHNCVFCGLYNDNEKNLERDKETLKSLQEFKSAKIDFDYFKELMQEIPESTSWITFGGAGEPFTHPKFMEMVKYVRQKNINLTVFSHLAGLKNYQLDQLFFLSGEGNPLSLYFVVNLSGATAATYQKTRPNQDEKSFNSVLHSLYYLRDKTVFQNRAVTYTIMCVANRLNYHEFPAFVALAKDVGALDLWIKPMELHRDSIKDVMIGENEQAKYCASLKLALYFADKIKLKILHREVIEELLKKEKDLIEEYEKEVSFEMQIKKALFQFPLLADWMLGQKNREPIVVARDTRADAFLYDETIKQTTPEENRYFDHHFSFDENSLIQNAGVPSKFYDENPCFIGRSYMRIMTTKDLLPCCIYPHSFMKKEGVLKDIWSSKKYNDLRQETEIFPKSKEHRKEGKWSFCHQCPHLQINSQYNGKLK